MGTLRMDYATFKTQVGAVVGLTVWWSQSDFFRAIAFPTTGIEYLFEAEAKPPTFDVDFPLAKQTDQIYPRGG